MNISNIQQRVAAQRQQIIQFLREICAIPSMDSQIGPVGERIAAEMRKLGFDEVRFDPMGNIIGRIGPSPALRIPDHALNETRHSEPHSERSRRSGRGTRVIVYDSHIDTVGVGDPAEWQWDPFQGKVENGVFYARGACDEKGSTPGMVYGLAIARDLGLLDGWTAYYFGNMEEWCDGIAPKMFVEIDPRVHPDFVVIGEPSRMQVSRGQKGRVEFKITAKGRSAHAASNHLGENAIYKLLPILAGIRDLEPHLGDHPFLGHGKITATDMKVTTASINAVPNEAVVYIDRRLTFGETQEQAFAQVQALIPPEARGSVKIETLVYDDPSYTGYKLVVDKYFPAWATDEDHPLIQAGLQARRLVGLAEAPTNKWDFSTNGNYWSGRAGIPCIGFAPGDETTAHTVMDCVPLEDVVKATEFYALLPGLISDKR